MKRLLTFLLLVLGLACGAQTYTEWYVQTTGNNLNSGHTADDAATFTATACNFTNDTSATACTIFKSGLNPVAGGVTNGAWASVFPDGATTNGFIGVITASDDTEDTITIAKAAWVGGYAGTVPASSVGGTTIYVGGAWKGPNTNAVSSDYGWPLTFIANTMTNSAGSPPCVNIKVGIYPTTNAIANANVGPYIIAGYTTTPRDGGRWTLDGTWAGPGYALMTFSGGNVLVMDSIFSGNGTSATAQTGLAMSGTESFVIRVTAHDITGTGINLSGSQCSAISCEAYNCGTSGAGSGGFGQSSIADLMFLNCISYSNNPSDADIVGFIMSGNATRCVSYRNGGDGFQFSGSSKAIFVECDSYWNGGDGIDSITATAQASYSIIGCNVFRNGGYGINLSGSKVRDGYITHCLFGSGTMANTTGPIASLTPSAVLTNNLIGFTANLLPWVDADNGNFRISSSLAKFAGFGTFVQSVINSPTNTVAYPDIGAGQSAAATTAHTFAQ